MSPLWRKRADAERDLDDEIQSHLRMAEADRRSRGQTAEEAAHAARRELGNVGHIKEVTRESWGGLWIDRLGQDVRYAIRLIRRAPGFALIVALTIGLGIGATTAVFTVVNGVLLRPLPFRNPDDLFLLSYQSGAAMPGTLPAMLDRNFLVVREQTRTFDRVATFTNAGVTVTGVGEPARLWSAMMTADLLPVLGVTPALGRGFRVDEERRGNNGVAIIGDRLWRERFGADSGVIGKTLTIDGALHTIVGVMPRGFSFPNDAALWTPLSVLSDDNNVYSRPVVGRLARGATRARAQAELESLRPQLATFPGTPPESWIPLVSPLSGALVGDVERSLWVFAGAVACVLLVACVNVANLLMLRGRARDHEIAVRGTLGATRPRLLRQLLTESLVLSLLGGAVGLGLAFAGVRALVALAPGGRIPRLDEVRIDGAVLGFTVAVSFVVGLGFGVLPALRLTGDSLRQRIANGGRSLTARLHRLPDALVVAQVVLSLVLLTGAGLLARSFLSMRSVDLGFDARNVVAMTLDLPRGSYAAATDMITFHDRMLERLGSLPGVEHAGLVNWRPLGPMRIAGDFRLDGGQPLPPNYRPDKLVVGGGYFRAMDIRVVRGRDFTSADDDGAQKVVIVSEAVARAAWRDANPVGRRITMEDEPTAEDWLTVIGVVEDVVQESIVAPSRPALYLPYGQVKSAGWLGRMGVTYVARGSTTPASIGQGMRQVLGEVDRNLPALAVAPMSDLVSSTIAEPLFQARLLGAFAALALILAAVGIYGVLAHAVAIRTHEIGVRMALGASSGVVLAAFLRRSLVLAGIGVVGGIAGAVGITRVLARFLYGITPTDPVTFAGAALLLCGVGLFAGLAPALRASRIDPIRALKTESR